MSSVIGSMNDSVAMNRDGEGRDEMSSALRLSEEVTLPQQWLDRLKEGEAKSHALMILPDIISRYCRKSETVDNHQYYMDHFDLSKRQVINALNCLESGGILKRIWICNMVNENGDPFKIAIFSDDFRNLLNKQRLGRQSQGETL